MKKSFLTLLIISSSVLAISCAPEVKHLAPPHTKPHFGPKQADAVLRFNGDPRLYEKLPSFKEQNLPTSEVLNTVENLLRLSYQENLPLMAKMAHQIQHSIYANSENIRSVGFEQSPYAKAIFEESGPEVRKELNAILKQVDYQQKLVSSLLDQRTIPAPKEARYPFAQFTKMVRDRLSNEVNFLKSNRVEPIIVDGLKQAIASEVLPKLDLSEPHIQTLLAAKTLERTLNALEKIFTTFQYTPAKELVEKIEFGYQVSHSIEGIHSEQSALTLIVQFWNMMTPAERIENFKPNSKDLYDYLVERNEHELKCLASDSCLDLMILIAKKKIFAGLREYGLAKLQDTFNNGARAIVIEQIERTTPQELAIIPQEIKKQVLPRIREKVVEITKIRDDFGGFLRNILLGWAKQNLYSAQSQTLPLLEKNQVRMALNNGKPSLSTPPNTDGNFRAQTVGSSFALTALRWSATDAQVMGNGRNVALFRSMMEQINKLLLTYEQRPLEGQARNKKQFDAFATGELIRGISLLSYHLRDWEPTVFDLHLGRVQIGELQIDALPNDIAQQNMFPKETFYALAIGNAGLQLKALSSAPSPVFTVDTENKIQWLDKATDNPNSPNVMAGVVDIINGKRSQLVRSSSLSKFLSALIQFYNATDKLDQTKAPRLLEKNASGKTSLDVILQSRTDIRDLIIGLSNFLSHQIKSDDGATLHSININETVVKNVGVLYLEDQINSINALLDSYEMFQTKIYLWSAIDTYYALNRTLWNPDADFYYSDTDKNSPNFPQRIATLRVLARLKEFLPVSSKQQTERILQINTKAFSL